MDACSKMLWRDDEVAVGHSGELWICHCRTHSGECQQERVEIVRNDKLPLPDHLPSKIFCINETDHKLTPFRSTQSLREPF